MEVANPADWRAYVSSPKLVFKTTKLSADMLENPANASLIGNDLGNLASA